MINEVSIQYARSLFELSDNKQIDLKNLEVMSSILKSDDVMKVMNHPLVESNAKKEIISNLIKDKVNPYFLHFMYVLVDNNRIDQITNIYETFQSLVDEENKILNVKVETKNPLTNMQEQKLIQTLKAKYQKDIIINQVINESLTGGIKIIVGNDILDASLDSMLLNLKNTLKG